MDNSKYGFRKVSIINAYLLLCLKLSIIIKTLVHLRNLLVNFHGNVKSICVLPDGDINICRVSVIGNI